MWQQKAGQAAPAPERMTPVVEHQAGVNFPYRGTQEHGVPVKQAPPAYIDEWPEESEEPYYAKGPTEDQPIPVRIVEGGRHRRSMLKAVRLPLSVGVVQRIVPRSPDGEKKRIVLVNNSLAGTVYVDSSPNVDVLTGFPIAISQVQPEFFTSEELYAITNDTAVELAVRYEYEVESECNGECGCGK